MKCKVESVDKKDVEPIRRSEMQENVIYSVVPNSRFYYGALQPKYAWLMKNASNNDFVVMTDIGVVFDRIGLDMYGKFVPTDNKSITLTFTME